MTESAEAFQARYYEQNVSVYDSMRNVRDDHERDLVLQWIEMIRDPFGSRAFLEGAQVSDGGFAPTDHGNECATSNPWRLWSRRQKSNGVSDDDSSRAADTGLPIDDGASNTVFECGVLQHVAEPALSCVRDDPGSERAVFLADSNRFRAGWQECQIP
jgi:hypothetical protein